MKVLRSWPEVVPEGRCYVVDTLPRYVMRDYDYAGLVDLDDDVLLVEWDLAVHPEQFTAFIDMARSSPTEVVTAPYRIYTATDRSEDFPSPPWVMRRYVDETEQSLRWCTPDDTHAHLFGLGLTYLPRDLIRAFVATGWRFGDVEFSGWHYKNVRQDVPIAWDVTPVHLHDHTRSPSWI